MTETSPITSCWGKTNMTSPRAPGRRRSAGSGRTAGGKTEGPRAPFCSPDPLGVPPPFGPRAQATSCLSSRAGLWWVTFPHPPGGCVLCWGRAARTPGFAAAARDASKRREYRQVPSALLFVPMSVESFGRLGAQALTLLGDLADQAVQAGGPGLCLGPPSFCFGFALRRVALICAVCVRLPLPLSPAGGPFLLSLPEQLHEHTAQTAQGDCTQTMHIIPKHIQMSIPIVGQQMHAKELRIAGS
jgi:hypothetical protein